MEKGVDNNFKECLNKLMDFNYPQICRNLLKDLPERQREVISRRFALQALASSEGGVKGETLESIGKSYGVTRERVRQIEADGMNYLKRPEILRITSPLFDYFQNYLKRQGGLKREDILLENLGKDKFKSQVFFLLTLGDSSFFRHGETKEFYPFWTINQELIPFFQKLIIETIEIFQEELKPLFKKEFLEVKLKDPKTSLEKKIDSQLVLSSLEISKKIEENPFGEVGLVNWPEINPRGVKDRAYLVLKKEEKPLHFQEITEKINQLKFYSEKPTLIQTVHNELIKDQRFVLVGRGTYALGEWGYYPGQVKDVILKILRETEGPLTKEEILEKVLKQRMVKENTILLNLGNKKYFLKNPQGGYQIKEI